MGIFGSVLFSAYVCRFLKYNQHNLFYFLYVGVPVSAHLIVRLKNKAFTTSSTEKLINHIWSLFGWTTI